MNLILKKITVFLLLIASVSGFGQHFLLSKNAQISVLTCDVGNESYSLFGHTAIRITDLENQIDVVYNYGAFDFATPNFVAKFTKGDLQYFVVAHSFSDFINEYQYEKRSVYEQELILPEVYKQNLFDNLSKTLQSDDRFYTYKFIDKNCTSMVIEIINKTLGSNVIVKKEDKDVTYRCILYPYFDNHFYEKLGTSIIFGKKVDELGSKIFLPFELQKALKTTRFQNKPLAKENKTLIAFQEKTPSSWWNNVYTYLLVLGFILIINKQSVDLVYLSIMGMLGVFFLFVGFYSFHQELACNYNVLLFNPTLLLLVYFMVMKNKKWIINLSVFNVLSISVFLIVMIQKIHLLIVLPLIITSLILLVKTAIKNSKKIPIVI